MQFLIDESLSPLLADYLKQLGYSAVSAREANLKGLPDTEIVEWAQKKDAAIITGDLDFGELWYWHYKGSVSIIVLRLKSYAIESQQEVIKFLHESKALREGKVRNSLIISTAKKYRIRAGIE